MISLFFRITFHGELDLFLKKNSEGTCRSYKVSRFSPLKDVIESIGVPHTEVGKIVSKDSPLNFFYIPSPGMDIDVYPVMPPVDVTRQSILRPGYPGHGTFVADVNVGKLARLLRITGFDTSGWNNWSDSFIAEISKKEQRIVLTKDRGLLQRRIIIHGHLVRAVKPWDQLAEIIHFYGLENKMAPFTLCPSCNEKLHHVEKHTIEDRLEPLTRLFFNEFKICPLCKKIYWAGNHHEKIYLKIMELKKNTIRGVNGQQKCQ